MVRDDGLKDILKKTGTPRWAEFSFLAGILVASLFLIPKYKEVAVVFLFTISYGIIGFLDDILKIKKRQSEGTEVITKIHTSACSQCYFYNISGIKYMDLTTVCLYLLQVHLIKV